MSEELSCDRWGAGEPRLPWFCLGMCSWVLLPPSYVPPSWHRDRGHFHMHSAKLMAKSGISIVLSKTSASRARGSLLLYFWLRHLASVHGLTSQCDCGGIMGRGVRILDEYQHFLLCQSCTELEWQLRTITSKVPFWELTKGLICLRCHLEK